MADTGPFGWFWATVYSLTHRNPESNRAVIELIDLKPTDRVLDVGCGAGAALLQAAGMVEKGTLAGLDPTEKLARLAARRVPSATIEVASVDDMPFADASFTAVWSISAYHHWPDQVAGLKEVHRVLEEGGSVHIAERHARGPGQHGLDESEIALLERRLTEAAFGAIQLRFVDVGRKEMAVVSAQA